MSLKGKSRVSIRVGNENIHEYTRGKNEKKEVLTPFIRARRE